MGERSFSRSWSLRASVSFAAFPLPPHFFFLLSSQRSRRTHVETLAMQATALYKLEIYCFPNFYSEKNEISDVYCLKKWRHFTVSSSHKLAQGKKKYSKERFWSRLYNRNMSKRCTVELSVERQVRLFWKVANRTVRTESLLQLFTSVQVLFFVLNTIQLYNELRSIKPKGGFYTHVVFKVSQSTCKRLVFLWVKRIWKTLSTCQKKTTAINVFIWNKLDFQNCFLTIFNLKTMYV